MGELGGFLRHEREAVHYRPVAERVRDWREVWEPLSENEIAVQAARCMDCGIPFCHDACPLANLIPDWNDLVYKGDWKAASERLHATNNFPEFTGRLCPAPCEGSCVLGINDDPVAIKSIEMAIADRAFAEGWEVPRPPTKKTDKSVAVIGSGPAGLAAAQQLTRAGHRVVVFERAPLPGGLLRYGIPDFKMEKIVLDRRLDQMRAEGTEFRCSVDAGTDLPAEDLRRDFDAILLAGGATIARDLALPGRQLEGIHLAMDYLTNPEISAAGKRVVILGGGDTGADCLGTAHRQGALSVHQLEILPRPPEHRAENNPWPQWPLVFRTSAAHEEGGERLFGVATERFVDDGLGNVRALQGRRVQGFEPIPGTDFEIPCDLVILALGFLGPQWTGLLEELGVDLDRRGNVQRHTDWMTSLPGVFVAGDMGRGQSLIVWAIAEGRSAAAAIDRWLMGETQLPSV
ncbi:MAG TPA: glutamate synthase subunit beta [Thermoanaerobaculia bacterium]|nr:glutamate synthase subunit beta [Thermoanaerobaculia bacterium]